MNEELQKIHGKVFRLADEIRDKHGRDLRIAVNSVIEQVLSPAEQTKLGLDYAKKMVSRFATALAIKTLEFPVSEYEYEFSDKDPAKVTDVLFCQIAFGEYDRFIVMNEGEK